MINLRLCHQERPQGPPLRQLLKDKTVLQSLEMFFEIT